MRLVKALFAAIILASSPAAAGACVPASGYPHRLAISAPVAARLLVRDAASIDLVVVESFSRDFALATRSRDSWVNGNAEEQAAGLEWLEQVRAEYSSDADDDQTAVAFRYRVLESLKGAGPSPFVMSGMRMPEQGLAASALPLRDLKYWLGQKDMADWESICDAPLYANTGAMFLMFRDTQGRLLRTMVPTRLKGETQMRPGPYVVPVKSTADPWVALVRRTVAQEAKRAAAR